jgi:CheY-like chemotaxis protein/anti-sigma regulatory factor (Ser/Thr protein kinase)
MTNCQNCHCKNVLVVEDDAVSRRVVSNILEKSGYKVFGAENLRNAIRHLTETQPENFSCVITDYQLPDGTGADLLAWLKKHHSPLTAIVITAHQEKDIIKSALRGGAANFLEKPLNFEKLEEAVRHAVTETCRLRRLAEADCAVKGIGEAQRQMVGADEGSRAGEIDLCYEPVRHAGGDFFYRFSTGPDREVCLLTDVSGHDLKAAFASAYFQGVVRGLLASGVGADQIFPKVNGLLGTEWDGMGGIMANDSGTGMSIAACAVALDYGARTATVYSQGTPVPVYAGADGWAREMGEGSYPLGWFADGLARSEVQSIAEPGSLYLWTDGLDALAESQRASALSLAYALRQAKEQGRRLSCLGEAQDDVLLAVINLSRNGNPGYFYTPLVSETYKGNEAGGVDAFQEHWRRCLTLALPQLSESRVFDILLASREALLNALNHGCEKDGGKRATFEISFDTTRAVARVRVSDPGPGHRFNLAARERRASAGVNGQHRGLMLMHGLADSTSIQRNGAEVTLNFECS